MSRVSLDGQRRLAAFRAGVLPPTLQGRKFPNNRGKCPVETLHPMLRRVVISPGGAIRVSNTPSRRAVMPTRNRFHEAVRPSPLRLFAAPDLTALLGVIIVLVCGFGASRAARRWVRTERIQDRALRTVSAWHIAPMKGRNAVKEGT